MEKRTGVIYLGHESHLALQVINIMPAIMIVR